jgi:hypothetical protein
VKLTKDNLPSDVMRQLFVIVEALGTSNRQILDWLMKVEEKVDLIAKGNVTIYETAQHITTGMGLQDTSENVMDISDKVPRSMLLTFTTLPLLMYLSFI